MTSKIKIAITSTIIAIIAVAGSFNEVKAYDITTSVSPTGNAWEWGSGTAWRQAQQNSNGESNNDSTGDAIFWGRFMNNSALNNYWILKTVTSGNMINFQEGYYYKTQLAFNVVGYSTTSGRYGVQMPQLNRLVLPSGAPYKLVSITPSYTQCWEAGHENGSLSTGGVWSVWTEQSCYAGNITYDVIVQATQTATGRLQLGDGASWFLQSFVWLAQGTGYGTLRPLTITEYKPDNASVINEEQQQAGQQAQQEGQQGSDASQNNVTQGTQSLLSAITGFVGVISNATPTNCRITGDMGALDLGELDFCQDNPPAIITTIGTLILIAITIPITIWVVKKIISLFRSFTNG